MQGASVDGYPADIAAIVGSEFLFKVEKSADHGPGFDNSYTVKRICAERDVISSFKDKDGIRTPKKVVS